jgi:hypothetical protein
MKIKLLSLILKRIRSILSMIFLVKLKSIFNEILKILKIILMKTI